MRRDPAEHRRHDLDRLDAELSDIEGELGAMVVRHTEEIERVNPAHRSDAVNLLHYLALRRHDSRTLQRRLSDLGLSSLGRCEPHVMASMLSIHSMVNSRVAELPNDVLGFRAGRDALDANTDALFGDRPLNRVPRIMVTLDDQAAVDPGFVGDLLSAGMNVARINGAHDDPAMWDRMASNVRQASAKLDVNCRIAMDLAGPKLRTGPLAKGPRITRLRPRRDLRGRPVAPVVFELIGVAEESSGAEPDEVDTPKIPVGRDWLLRRRIGEEIHFVDARGAHRRAHVADCGTETGSVLAELRDTTYLETGIALNCGNDATLIGPLRAREQCHVLDVGDRLSMVRPGHIALPWHHGDPGTAELACSLDDVFGSVAVGDRVLLDDGKFSGRVEVVEDNRFLVEIVDAPLRGGKLRAEKGINLPDTELDIPLLSDADMPLIEFAASRADMLSLSFLRREEDVDAMRAVLASLGAADLAIVLKIETQAGFTNLPRILLHAMRSPHVGVMIARGDLAVEMGYGRLAEVQEEILWLAESAHLPVIWATEVLDRLATTGRPSRA
jgi:pyruvate kinase